MNVADNHPRAKRNRGIPKSQSATRSKSYGRLWIGPHVDGNRGRAEVKRTAWGCAQEMAEFQNWRTMRRRKGLSNRRRESPREPNSEKFPTVQAEHVARFAEMRETTMQALEKAQNDAARLSLSVRKTI